MSIECVAVEKDDCSVGNTCLTLNKCVYIDCSGIRKGSKIRKKYYRLSASDYENVGDVVSLFQTTFSSPRTLDYRI